MRRREFVTLLVAAAAWPVAAAGQPKTQTIGFLHAASAAPFAKMLAAFKEGLHEAGFIDGHNVVIEYRWAEGNYDRLQPLAEELVRRPVNVIVAVGGSPSAVAARSATATIPILFNTGLDPVRLGWVTSLNRPGGNATGVTQLNVSLAAKRLELLHELLPAATRAAMLVNPANPSTEPEMRETSEAARLLDIQVQFLNATSEREIDNVLAHVSTRNSDGLLLSADLFFFNRRSQLAEIARRNSLPAVYAYREFTEVGGLLSYGGSNAQSYRQLGIYAGRILKGEKPADLPVVQPTKFELVLNLKTAKALGLEVPATLLARADEVIE